MFLFQLDSFLFRLPFLTGLKEVSTVEAKEDSALLVKGEVLAADCGSGVFEPALLLESVLFSTGGLGVWLIVLVIEGERVTFRMLTVAVKSLT